jgi:hypothetical protein
MPIRCLQSRLPGSQRASRALIALGLAGSVPAAAAGLADWSALHREQQRVGLAHGAANASAWTLFAGSLAARAAGREASGCEKKRKCVTHDVS